MDNIYDAVIRRFGFTYELAWNLMEYYLEYQGIVLSNSPRPTFKEAFMQGIRDLYYPSFVAFVEKMGAALK